MSHALVVGAGIAGLAAGIALRQAGWSVELVDRAPALEPAGAALSLWPNAMAGLRRLGAAARIEREAEPITRLQLALVGGRTLLDLPVADARLTTRALLQSALREVLGDVPVDGGCEALAVTSAECGEVAFADGIRRADLVVVADGIGSRLAAELLGNRPRYCGYTGVVALSDPVAGMAIDGVAAEYWSDDERFGLFDLGGGRRYWFHMRAAPLGAPALRLDELAARAARWPVAVRDAIAATPAHRLIAWPIHARAAPRRLAIGRVVCVGDAAHAMQPNLGQGACQAIEDAVALGVAATGAPDDIARRFEPMRLTRVRGMVRRSAEGGLAAHGPAGLREAMRLALWVVPRGLQARMIAGLHDLPAYRG